MIEGFPDGYQILGIDPAFGTGASVFRVMINPRTPLPSQTQLMLPMLEAIEERGGAARPRDLYDAIAEKVDLSRAQRDATDERSDRGSINLFERKVRWTRQTAILKGLMTGETRGQWQLTASAKGRLQNIVRGAVLTVFETDRGIYVWANAEDAIGYVEKGSVDLIMTSPPYPLLKKREYGNVEQRKWVDWMVGLCEGWMPLFSKTGSMMLNLGNAWVPGAPAESSYIERLVVKLEDELGMNLIQRLYWHNPAKLPAPLQWVGIRRLRVKQSVEPVLWMSPNRWAKGNNRNVLTPYTPGGLRAIERKQNDRTHARPSGYEFGNDSFVDQGGAIPPSLITCTTTQIEEQRYQRAERAAGRLPHPAIMPAAVARFGILLSTDEDDVVLDPMSGSGTVPVEAEKLNRYAIAGERSREYLRCAEQRGKAEGLRICA